ncbi:hypothetical protein [Serratia sp. M24T3]|uniref:hypothetical protein n=1 Tax=Serratia sp. M24T3 TaxID=932213 RepID=UPI00025B906C|nr:hypothetical protein [Serratia sp. M24T3]EIC85441.1 hypothetical protein SPM24T3_06248 [Serratia sp. M24T3]
MLTAANTLLPDISSLEITTPLVIPYFSQWESPSSAPEILSGKKTLQEIENWPQSGAQTQEEYIEWANHVCGMCCLKMALAATTGEIVPILELTRRSLPYGAYVQEGDNIRGLIYAPFVEFLKQELNIGGQVRVEMTAEDIAAELDKNHFFIASVHPGIRHPEIAPPRTGGHLVLVTAVEQETLTFHNPSGHNEATQSYVKMPVSQFAQFFAGRGVAMMPRIIQDA